jgi:hypothetical protein
LKYLAKAEAAMHMLEVQNGTELGPHQTLWWDFLGKNISWISAE